MKYKDWFTQHGQKHARLMQKLLQRGMNRTEIIQYFDFDNMVRMEPDFCVLYEENRKCHAVEKLNCFLCACPLFRFKDEGSPQENGQTLYSECAVNARLGQQFTHKNAIHQDCTACAVPHSTDYVRKNYNKDWFIIMQDCDQEDSA